MKKSVLFLICLVSVLLLTSCGSSYYMPNRPYGYKPNFSRTYSDQSVYRPSHYRNFVRENSQYLNDRTRVSATDGSVAVRGDDVYLVKSYLDAHVETERPVYHTTYTTSYNDNGEVTTTYTTDYVGTKRETQYWNEVKKEQKKMYKEARKKKKYVIRGDDD